MLVMHFVDSDLVSCQLLRTVPMLRPQLYYNTIQCEWAPCCAGREENEEWSQGEHDRSIVTNEKIDLKIKLKVQWVSLRIQFLVRIVSIHCAHQVRPDLLTLEDQAQAFEGYWLDETRSRFSIRTSNSAREHSLSIHARAESFAFVICRGETGQSEYLRSALND